ncbi:MAG: hypothetical protein P8Z36_05795 [Gemmatimonadota bacterium]
MAAHKIPTRLQPRKPKQWGAGELAAGAAASLRAGDPDRGEPRVQ